MGRYIIQGEFLNDVPSREIVRAVNPEIERSHLYTSIFSYKTQPLGENSHNPDMCLNRYDLYQALFDKIMETGYVDKLWMIDPKFVTFDMAIEFAKLGYVELLTEKYLNKLEFNVLSYLAGAKLSYWSMDKVKDIALENKDNIEGFIADMKEIYKDMYKEDYENYLKEEKRALEAEEERLASKNDYCLDLLTEIAIARNNLLDKKRELKK